MIPLPYTIGHRVYVPGAKDPDNNPIDYWADPDPVAAVWYIPDSQEPLLAGHDRVTVDLVAYVHKDLVTSPRDRFEVGTETFDLIGVAGDYNHGPWWVPGLVVLNLKRVVG